MSYSSEVLADSPLGYWRLGEASGTTMSDSSGNSRNGTYSASPTLGSTGLLVGDSDTSATFDGTSYGTVSDAAWMDVTTASVEAWFATTQTNARKICGRWGSGSTRFMSVELGASDLVLVQALIGGTVRTASATVTGLRDDNPHHVVGTYDGTTLRLYVDKVEKATLSISGTIDASTGAFRVARNDDGTSRFIGRLDEVAFYGAALSATRVAAHYDAGSSLILTLGGDLPQWTSDLTLDAGPFITLGGDFPQWTSDLAINVEAEPELTLGGDFPQWTSSVELDAGRNLTVGGDFPQWTSDASLTVSETLTVAGSFPQWTSDFQLAQPVALTLGGSVPQWTSSIALDAGRLISLQGSFPQWTSSVTALAVPDTQRHNRLGGRFRNGLGVVTYEPPVVALPAELDTGHDKEIAQVFSQPVISGTDAPPVYTVTTAEAQRERTRILVGGKDVSFFRNIVTPEPQYSLIEPLSYGPGSITFPQIASAFEEPGVGALRWARKGARVLIQRVNASDVVIATDYRGFVAGYQADGNALVIELGGELSGRASLQWAPPPIWRTTSDVGSLAYFWTREHGLKFSPRGGPATGIEVVNFGGMDGLARFQQLCSLAQHTNGTQWTIEHRRILGDYRMVQKDMSTIRATLYLDDSRIVGNLRRDFSEEPNRIYATGVTPEGMKVRFGVYPGLRQGDPAPYPMDDNSSFGVGTTDAMTDTGDGVTVMMWRLVVTGYLTWRQMPEEYDATVERAVKALQADAGNPETGTMTLADWQALFDLTKTGYSLSLSKVMPAAQRSRVRPWNRTGSGSIAKRNPGYDPHELKIDTSVDVGTGFTRPQIRSFAARKIGLTDPNARDSGLAESKNWVGDVSISGYALIDGEHNPGDPAPTSADVLPARAIREGDNIWLPLFDGGTLVHVSAVEVNGRQVRLSVDTRARDALEVWEVIARNRESRVNPARQFLANRRSSTLTKDALVGFDEIGGTVDESVSLTGGKWNVFPVVAGQEGTVRRIKIATSPAAEYVMAVFGKRITERKLNQLIQLPLGEGSGFEESARDVEVRREFERHVLLYAAGDWQQPCGYFPNVKQDDEGPTAAVITGDWEDDAGFSYHTFQGMPVIWVAIYPSIDCKVPAGRIMWPQLEEGS